MNKLFIVCLFALVAASSASMASSENLRSSIMALLQTEKNESVKSVYDVLVAFQKTQHDHRDAENARWAKAEPVLLKKIADEESELKVQQDLCNDMQSTIDAQTAERDAYQKNHDDALEKIARNNDAVEKRNDQRCQNTLIYLQKLRSSRNAVELLTYLKNEMSKDAFKNTVAKQPEVFLTLKEVVNHKHENSLGELYKLHLMAVFAQAEPNTTPMTNQELDATFDINARTESEIGSGHVDNDRAALNLDDYAHNHQDLAGYITKVIGFIQTLIDEFENDMKDLESAEEKAVEAYLAFRTRIERENHVLTIFATQCAARVAELNEVINHNTKMHNQCTALLPKYEAELRAAQEHHAEEKEKHETKIRNLENTFPIIDRAIQEYVKSVKSAKTEYKDRVKDYTDDNIFNGSQGNNSDELTHRGSIAVGAGFKEEGTINGF